MEYIPVTEYMLPIYCKECDVYLGTMLTLDAHQKVRFLCNLCSLSAADMQQAVEGSYLLSASTSLPVSSSEVLGFSAGDQDASTTQRSDRWAFIRALENLRLNYLPYASPASPKTP